jgi:hypothetical protein
MPSFNQFRTAQFFTVDRPAMAQSHFSYGPGRLRGGLYYIFEEGLAALARAVELTAVPALYTSDGGLAPSSSVLSLRPSPPLPSRSFVLSFLRAFLRYTESSRPQHYGKELGSRGELGKQTSTRRTSKMNRRGGTDFAQFSSIVV